MSKVVGTQNGAVARGSPDFEDHETWSITGASCSALEICRHLASASTLVLCKELPREGSVDGYYRNGSGNHFLGGGNEGRKVKVWCGTRRLGEDYAVHPPHHSGTLNTVSYPAAAGST